MKKINGIFKNIKNKIIILIQFTLAFKYFFYFNDSHIKFIWTFKANKIYAIKELKLFIE